VIEAVKSDDADGVMAQLGGHNRTRAELSKAYDAWNAALANKFGKAAFPIQSNSPKFKQEIEVRGKNRRSEDRYAFTIWKHLRRAGKPDFIDEETWLVVKEKGVWKVMFPEKGYGEVERRTGPDGKEFEIRVLHSHEKTPEEIAIFQKNHGESKQLYEAFTKKVQDGKYGTREDAQSALLAVQMRLTKEMDAALKKLRKSAATE
jgi:hypothetical protein